MQRTHAPQSLFAPDSARRNARGEIDAARELLEEVRNYGLLVLDRCWQHKPDGIEHRTMLLVYRRLLEMLDGIVVLLNAAAVVPARMQARAILELLFTLAFISQKDTPRRAQAYVLVNDLIERRGVFLRGDPEAERGKQFRRTLGVGVVSQATGFSPPTIPDAAARLKEIDDLLASETYRDVYEEYQQCKARHGGSVQWYELFAGPRNIEALARDVGYADLYEQTYRLTSGTIHGQDVLRGGLLGEDMRPLRSTEELIPCAIMVSGIAALATDMIMEQYRPQGVAPFANWLVQLKPLRARVEKLDLRPR